MHLGRCVLCSDIPGNRELVSDGETGVLFGSIEELTQRLRQLLLDPALRLSLGRNAQASVHRRHTARSEARHYINVYRHLIGAVS